MSQAYFPSFNIQFVNQLGEPLSSGKVYAFYSDGITPAPTYNQAGNPNSHPITLTPSGTCQLKGDDTISYTIISKDSGGATMDSWVGVSIPSGGGSGATVTMDTIAQGTAYKKVTTAQYISLVGGANTTLHYHSADRAWSAITGKPSTFTPSAHATSHKTGGSDVLVHNDLAPAKAATGVSYGHIDAGSQVIAGNKTFSSSLTYFGDQAVRDTSQVTIDGVNGTFSAQGGANAQATVEAGRSTDSGLVQMLAQDQLAWINAQQSRSGVISYVRAVATYEQAYLALQSADALLLRIGIDAGVPNIQLSEAIWTSDEAIGNYVLASKAWATSQFGNAAIAYNHTQGSAALVWTITHGKTYYPVIQCVDSTGAVVNGSIQHSAGYATVTFAFATSGTARAV